MTPTEFKAIFPAFASESDERIQVQLNLADPSFDVARWGGFYTLGLANYVAHQLTVGSVVSNGSRQEGVISKKVGEVQVTKSEAILLKQMSNPFNRTHYGQEYLALSRRVGMGAITV